MGAELGGSGFRLGFHKPYLGEKGAVVSLSATPSENSIKPLFYSLLESLWPTKGLARYCSRRPLFGIKNHGVLSRRLKCRKPQPRRRSGRCSSTAFPRALLSRWRSVRRRPFLVRAVISASPTFQHKTTQTDLPRGAMDPPNGLRATPKGDQLRAERQNRTWNKQEIWPLPDLAVTLAHSRTPD